MSFEENDLLVITQQEDDTRLDKILSARFQNVKSRTYFQDLIEKGQVLLNGKVVKKRCKPKTDDEIEINFMITPEIGLNPENIPLNIVYEDEDILVVNKPAGMVVHPAQGHWSGTFVNALLYHCKELFKGDSLVNSKGTYSRPGIVHRLDKDTTGLLIAAKNSTAHERLVQMFAERRIHKEYVAICVGNPGVKEIKNNIGRHPVHRKLMTVVDVGGKEAVSLCKPLMHSERFSLVNIILETGRTHQIRVHMKHLGTPILGCPLYGNLQLNKKHGAKRQMLHASSLKFNHPIKDTPLEFKLEIPADMKAFIQTLIA
jgi:23S rRNA pseudouridine1911/1915/1917 synthase